MLKYLVALFFAIFGDNEDLLMFWRKEIVRRDKIQLHRLLREKNNNRCRNFLFWWRLANEMHINGGRIHKKAAEKLNVKL